MIRLAELSPEWLPWQGRDKCGIRFRCPCDECGGAGAMIVVWFENPVDGGPTVPEMPYETETGLSSRWNRFGETFETLSLSPSIDASISGHWHGFVTNGKCV
jgi:hypothetical protein